MCRPVSGRREGRSRPELIPAGRLGDQTNRCAEEAHVWSAFNGAKRFLHTVQFRLVPASWQPTTARSGCERQPLVPPLGNDPTRAESDRKPARRSRSCVGLRPTGHEGVAGAIPTVGSARRDRARMGNGRRAAGRSEPSWGSSLACSEALHEPGDGSHRLRGVRRDRRNGRDDHARPSHCGHGQVRRDPGAGYRRLCGPSLGGWRSRHLRYDVGAARNRAA